VSFAVGAVVPVLPWLVAGGAAAVAWSVALSAAALLLVGTGISLLTGRSVAWSAGRQLLVGALAAAATFGIGRLIGVSVS
jgi:VIT1/CCC1 family predicted Fe2+/Mn2+ transporter